jgi:hypothetical protein
MAIIHRITRNMVICVPGRWQLAPLSRDGILLGLFDSNCRIIASLHQQCAGNMHIKE